MKLTKSKLLRRGIVLFLFSPALCWAAGPYSASIKLIQATDEGHAHNSVHLDLDVTNSPCSGTNQFDRFAIRNNVQQSVIVAAMFADKPITIYGTGVGNGGANEEISDVRVSR